MFSGIVWHKICSDVPRYAGIIAQAPVAFIAVCFQTALFLLMVFYSVRCIFQTFAAVMKNECFAFCTYII